jgi:chromosome segregation ATPase
VKEENEPLRNEIARLTELCETLQSKLDNSTHQIESSTREKTQIIAKFDKVNADFAKAQVRIT